MDVRGTILVSLLPRDRSHLARVRGRGSFRTQVLGDSGLVRLHETEGRGVLGGSAPLGYPSHRSFFGGRWQQWSCLDRKL